MLINYLRNLLNNKKILFIMICSFIFNIFFGIYNRNFIGKQNGEVLFYEVLIVSIFIICIVLILYIILKKIFCNHYVALFLLWPVLIVYSYTFSLSFCLLFLILEIPLVFLKKIHFKIIVIFFSLMSFFLFVPTFIRTSYYLIYNVRNSVHYVNDFEIKVNDDKNVPNVYWVHTDAMLGMNAMNKYFEYDNQELRNYFNDNNYIYNENAKLKGGQSTKRALPALFNPNYYDTFYKEYLYDLENVYLEKKNQPDKIVSYYELTNKRINNELFDALKKKQYTTYAIGSFDQYTSLYTDYYYDFGLYDNRLSLLEYEKNKNKYGMYIKLQHFQLLNKHIGINYNINNILEKKSIDYKNIKLNDYKYTNKSDDLMIKAIHKSLSLINETDNSRRFVFIDYFVNHIPYKYDENGELLNSKHFYDINSYKGNYKYSVKLLIELLKYIKECDSEAIIIVQSDHGINYFKDSEFMKKFNISNEEVQELRNSVMNAVYIPDKHKKDESEVVKNPLNITRYLVNNYVGQGNYEYLNTIN